PPEMGAPQARLSELARRFVDRGHEVIVLTAMPNYPRGKIFPGYGGLLRREQQDGVRLIRTTLFPTKRASMIPRLTNYFSFVGSSLVCGAFSLPRIDYLMTESPPLFLGISGYLLSRLKGTRLIFNVADLWPQSAVELGVVKEGPALRMALALERFCYRKAWLVSCQNGGILESIERRFPDVPTHHLSNGVDPELFHPDVPSKRQQLGLGGDDECVVLYAGLHGLAQGLGQVLEAAAKLRDVEGLRFAMVGDGPEKENLMARAAELELDNMRFFDPQPRDAMPQLLASADLSIACLERSMIGAVPSKIYEAMGAGRPIVLAADGEPADIVNRSGAGLTVPSGDVDGLAAAIRRLAEHPQERRALGERGRQAALERYNRGKIAKAFIDRLEDALK
ncbi:MAG: glycosyltransferase family 4 protein, partial [Acidobacteriota bacterium]